MRLGLFIPEKVLGRINPDEVVVNFPRKFTTYKAESGHCVRGIGVGREEV